MVWRAGSCFVACDHTAGANMQDAASTCAMSNFFMSPFLDWAHATPPANQIEARGELAGPSPHFQARVAWIEQCAQSAPRFCDFKSLERVKGVDPSNFINKSKSLHPRFEICWTKCRTLCWTFLASKILKRIKATRVPSSSAATKLLPDPMDDMLKR